MIDFIYESDGGGTDCLVNITKPMDNLHKYEVNGQVFYTYKNPKIFLEIAGFLNEGKAIGAIKLHRAEAGVGLRESRNYILPFRNVMYRNIMVGLVSQLLVEEPQYLI